MRFHQTTNGGFCVVELFGNGGKIHIIIFCVQMIEDRRYDGGLPMDTIGKLQIASIGKPGEQQGNHPQIQINNTTPPRRKAQLPRHFSAGEQLFDG